MECKAKNFSPLDNLNTLGKPLVSNYLQMSLKVWNIVNNSD